MPWPGAQLRHLVIVSVPAGNGEPAHEHADLRFFMATRTPMPCGPRMSMPRCAGCHWPRPVPSSPRTTCWRPWPGWSVSWPGGQPECPAAGQRRRPAAPAPLPGGPAAQQRGGRLSGQRAVAVGQLHDDRVLVHGGPHQAVIQRHLGAGIGVADQQLGRPLLIRYVEPWASARVTSAATTSTATCCSASCSATSLMPCTAAGLVSPAAEVTGSEVARSATALTAASVIAARASLIPAVR